MHSFMTHSLTTRYGPHDRCMPSQAVEVEWSSHTMDFYGWISRGPLQLVMVHAVVQWFALFRCVWRPRAIARSTSHSVCHSTCCEWLVWRQSRAPGAQSGQSPASDMDSARTVAGAVAAGRSAAGFTRILRSVQKVSFFRPSAAATRLCVRIQLYL